MLNNEKVYVEVRTQFDPFAKDKIPMFYYFVYRNSEELVLCDIEWINDRKQLFNTYEEAFEAAIEEGLKFF